MLWHSILRGILDAGRKHQQRWASGRSGLLATKSLCVKNNPKHTHRSCMQVHAPGSSTDKLPPPTEQDKHDDAWLAFSACCHDDGLPPKPCVSIMSPWSKKREGGEPERERKMNELCESCPSNLHYKIAPPQFLCFLMRHQFKPVLQDLERIADGTA